MFYVPFSSFFEGQGGGGGEGEGGWLTLERNGLAFFLNSNFSRGSTTFIEFSAIFTKYC